MCRYVGLLFIFVFYKIVCTMKSFSFYAPNSLGISALCLLFYLSSLMYASAQNVIGQVDVPTTIVVSDDGDVLLDKGRRMIDQMYSLACSKDYVEYCSVSPEVNRRVGVMADRLKSTPKSVFVMKNIGFDDLKKFSNASSDIYSLIKERMLLSLPSRLNAMSGSEVLVAASLLYVDDSFLFYGLDESVMYLYLLASDCAVIVIYRPASLWNVQAHAGIVVGDFWNDIDSVVDATRFFAEKLGVRTEISKLK